MGTNSSFWSVRYFHLAKRISADTTFVTKADARAFLASVKLIPSAEQWDEVAALAHGIDTLIHEALRLNLMEALPTE